jgi:hypothetical protein
MVELSRSTWRRSRWHSEQSQAWSELGSSPESEARCQVFLGSMERQVRKDCQCRCRCQCQCQFLWSCRSRARHD